MWKQKYKTLQGMYDKEVPQLHSEVKTLTKELEALKESLTKKAEETPKQEQKLVTDEDVQNFGKTLLKFSVRLPAKLRRSLKVDSKRYSLKTKSCET